MTKATYENGMIIVRGPHAEAAVQLVMGARKIAGEWTVPVTPYSCERLEELGIALDDVLTRSLARARKVRAYVEKVKVAETVEPLRPVPIKGAELYQHQIKAYNIALALFGQSAKKGDSDAKKD